MVNFGANDMMPHFIYCHVNEFLYYSYLHSKEIEKMFLKKMREYGIQSSILTTLHMNRRYLITKEESKLAAEGKLKEGSRME